WRDIGGHRYADTAPAVLVGWIVGAQFDCYTLTAHLMGLYALVVFTTRGVEGFVRSGAAPAGGPSSDVP
ncbi:MAG: hypothetical protein ACYTG1_07865, partial [Planctomycetota bacterium]